jgi:N-acetyl-gamma-glutamyl-phosphate reductase
MRSSLKESDIEMIKVGIVGGSGYTGGETARMVCTHPEMELVTITSRRQAGLKVTKVHPFLKGFVDIRFDESLSENSDIDLAFLATPHGASMDFAPPLLEKGIKVVDLSGDYRLKMPRDYRQWYGIDHRDVDNLKKAVYGIPELFHDAITSAELVANPGCYPTCSVLATAPLFSEGLVEGKLIVDAKSGTSGAGMEPSQITHHPTCAAGIIPYKVGQHRHTPEIKQALESVGNGSIEVVFTPHLVPIVRGIFSTCYVTLKNKMDHESLYDVYEKFYKGKPFIRVNGTPNIASVAGSNFCEIGFELAGEKNVVVMATIDNLTKGGAGQAVQNANIMFGLDETTGLNFPGLGV